MTNQIQPSHREEKLIKIISGLIANLRAKHLKYGAEYCGGLPINFALTELRKMGIKIEDE